eukprot:1273211-Heterocapsa_arctica.AAC.1
MNLFRSEKSSGVRLGAAAMSSGCTVRNGGPLDVARVLGVTLALGEGVGEGVGEGFEEPGGPDPLFLRALRARDVDGGGLILGVLSHCADWGEGVVAAL